VSETSHPYIPNDVEAVKKKMLNVIGVKGIVDLFSDIPEEARLKRPLNIPKPMSELDARREVERILQKNKTTKDLDSFLGAGAWPHYVPAVVDNVGMRTEFVTAYTPYQAEASQGELQTFFEYQSLICELVGLDVANCSVYDWATALGEAARMTARVKGRKEFIVPHFIHSERLDTLRLMSEPAGIIIKEMSQDKGSGQIDLEDLKGKINQNTAGVYVENPSFLGHLVESVKAISEIVHEAKSLFVVGVDPISLGVLEAPGNYGADIVIGEGQPLGNYMNFGGPLLGIFASRGDTPLIRQMPGRISGLTTTMDGKERGYCLTMSTREQHIRRDKATSNICTNEALLAVRSAIYMALLGKKGFRRLGEQILNRSHYTMKLLSEVKGVKTPAINAAHFKEFTVNFDGAGKKVKDVNRELLERGIIGGKPLNSDFPELEETALYCVTEMHTPTQIVRLQENLREIMEG